MNYVLSLIPLTILFGLVPSTVTYEAPIPPVLEQSVELPQLEVKPSQIAVSSPTEPVKEPDITTSCVRYVVSKVPEAPLIDAIDYPVNTINPKVGDIIKLQYYNATTSKFIYHIAYLEEITEEGYKISQGNKPKNATSTETIKKDNDNIVGFFDVQLWREIQKLPQDLQDTLKCESNFSHYEHSAVKRGKDGEWGMGQFMKGTWKWFTDIRRNEHLPLLDILNPYDQIKMMEWAFGKNLQSHWTCYDIVSSTD